MYYTWCACYYLRSFFVFFTVFLCRTLNSHGQAHRRCHKTWEREEDLSLMLWWINMKSSLWTHTCDASLHVFTAASPDCTAQSERVNFFCFAVLSFIYISAFSCSQAPWRHKDSWGAKNKIIVWLIYLMLMKLFHFKAKQQEVDLQLLNTVHLKQILSTSLSLEFKESLYNFLSLFNLYRWLR